MAERKKLTPSTQKKFIEAINRGVRPLVHLCSLAGITTITYNTWRDAWERGDDPEQDKLDSFFNAVEFAKAERIARYLESMVLSGGDDWRMWKAMIHMADPAGYPEKPDVAVTNNATVTIKGYAIVSPDDWDDKNESSDNGTL
jgi:hypothetical protein